MKWFVYIVKCQDGSLYTGVTTDIKRRISEHNSDDKKGAKSLRGKRPVHLVYTEAFQTQTEACKREIAIKNWKRKYKLKLINRAHSSTGPTPRNFSSGDRTPTTTIIIGASE